MKILYITHTTDGSGARVALVNMAKGLIARGHVVYVMTPAMDCKVSNSMREIGATVLVAPVCSTVYPKTKNFVKWIILFIIRLFKWIIAKKCIRKAVVNNGIDIVHTNVGPLNLAPSICRSLSIPHVWHIREFQKEFKITFFPSPSNFLKDICKKGNYNIAVTESVYVFFHLRKDIDRVIYDGVFPIDLINQNYKPFNQRDKIILFVGRIEEAKGTIDLIKAFVSFHKAHKDWQLRIVGDYNENSPYFQDCKKVCNDYSCKDYVTFLGKRNDVFRIMCLSRILVVPSLNEAFGFVTAEGMANGCLVIGRNTGGTKEQFENGKRITGSEIALRFETQDELVSQLCNAAEIDYSEMIERARRVAIQLYSLERTSEQVEDYYKWIIKNYNETKS